MTPLLYSLYIDIINNTNLYTIKLINELKKIR